MNIAYRWFLGLKFHDMVPHHSTINWNRQHRFKDTDIFQEIFDEIVLQAMNHKMVGLHITIPMYALKKQSKSCNTTCMGGAQGKGKVKSLI